MASFRTTHRAYRGIYGYVSKSYEEKKAEEVLGAAG